MAKKESEQDKAAGKTESQQAQRAYHEGKFQTHDPVTGEKRGPLAHHAKPENQGGTIGEEVASGDIDATDAARELANDQGVNIRTVKGTGAGGRITVDDVRAAAQD